MTPLNVIHEPSDLSRVRGSQIRPGRSLQLRIPGLEPKEARAWETKLNRHYAACGCGTSAAFLGVALCVSAFVLAGRAGGVLAVGAIDLGLAAFAVLAAGVVGKLVGMAVARVRLQLVVRSLWRRLQR